MVVKEWSNGIRYGVQDNFDITFASELKSNKAAYRKWVTENPEALIRVDVFTGNIAIRHGIEDTYKNVFEACKRNHWKFIITGVHIQWTHPCKEIWKLTRKG